MPGEKTPEQIEEEKAAAEAEADSKLNAVVKSHLKRELKEIRAQLESLKGFDPKSIESTISATIAKALEGKESEGKRGADGKFSEKGDPQVKLLLEKQEKLAKDLQEERERRQAVESRAKKDATRGKLKELLDAKGVRGARSTAVIAMLEAAHLGESEGGEPMLKVSRSRAKGAPVEELEFDLAGGIEDWCKTADAQEFLPAPGTQTQRAGQQQGQQGLRRQAKTYDKPAASDQEMVRRTAEQLTAQGVDLARALTE